MSPCYKQHGLVQPLRTSGFGAMLATGRHCERPLTGVGSFRATSGVAFFPSPPRGVSAPNRLPAPSPGRSSPILPTRADSVAMTALPDRGKRVREHVRASCSLGGTIAFIAQYRANLTLSSYRQLFSGKHMLLGGRWAAVDGRPNGAPAAAPLSSVDPLATEGKKAFRIV